MTDVSSIQMTSSVAEHIANVFFERWWGSPNVWGLGKTFPLLLPSQRVTL